MGDSAPAEGKVFTLAITPRSREAIKPAELIQVTGHHELTLNARRSITILWHNAHVQGVEEGRDYTIEIDDLKPDGHKGYEMVEEAVEALMRTIITVRMSNGTTRRVQFLGGNDMDSPDRPAGVLTYSFDKRLVEVLKSSIIWGKIQIPVLMAFTSKYAVSLYENASQFANLEFKSFQDYSLDEFREMLGVLPGQYKTFGELNMHVLKPVLAEVNALAPFTMAVLPTKQGKKVTGIRLSWWKKDADALKDAWDELQRPKVGRKARLGGTVERVGEPMPSVGRLLRQDRKRRAASPETS
ncbi:replication initiation protein [Methylobacterium sp. NEAU 140]|uniref:replication initiation protein n=1 Tax=Methylobacterium sp. NEAU 140 TaxID=3064945 RepID=UPI002733A8D6|nr:replication initiation protein [Methylobacterium sp. NEAU 140]MDP4026603.1 replication initiation protein [Methylobacterium sp. NEAU 140]